MVTIKMKLKEYLSEGKNDITKNAQELADNIIDDIYYRIKDFFGGWPEDSIGKVDADKFYKAFWTQLRKNIKGK